MPYDKSVKELVVLRLRTTPSNLTISIGSYGDFTRDQLIREVEKGGLVGEAAVQRELLFLRKMATLPARIAAAQKDG